MPNQLTNFDNNSDSATNAFDYCLLLFFLCKIGFQFGGGGGVSAGFNVIYARDSGYGAAVVRMSSLRLEFIFLIYFV